LIYKYSLATGRLSGVESYVDNTTLRFFYAQERLTQMEHSNGKRLNISYTSGGLIQSIDLISQDNDVEQTR